MYPIFVVTSTSPQHIIGRDRTIAVPVDFEGILKMGGASGLPLATSLQIRRPYKSRRRREPLAGASAASAADVSSPSEELNLVALDKVCLAACPWPCGEVYNFHDP
jgi:hypothetical protein